MPTNSTANATEIRLSRPTAMAAKPVVSSSPRISVNTIGTISRQERTASVSHTSTSTTLPMVPAAMPSATVENSSSASATSPVNRTCACPARTNSNVAAAARMASLAAPPGSSES